MTLPFGDNPSLPEQEPRTSIWARIEGRDGGIGVDASGLEHELSDMHTVNNTDYEYEKRREDASNN